MGVEVGGCSPTPFMLVINQKCKWQRYRTNNSGSLLLATLTIYALSAILIINVI